MLHASLRVVALAVALLASTAYATSVTVTDPGNGGAYTLDVVLQSGTTDTYLVTLTADIGPANPLLNGAVYIEQAEFKISTGYSSVSFMSGPAGATWTDIAGPLGANGCGGNNSSFVCIDASGGPSLTGGIAIGSTTSFQWQAEVTLASGAVLDTSWHIGLLYSNDTLQCSGPPTNQTCRNGIAGIVSLSTPPIPEPTAAAVFGTGALLVAAVLRRRAR